MVDVTAPFFWVVFSLQDKLGGPKWCDGHHTAFALLLAFKLTHLESDTSLSTDKQTIPSNSCFATSKPGSCSGKKNMWGVSLRVKASSFQVQHQSQHQHENLHELQGL